MVTGVNNNINTQQPLLIRQASNPPLKITSPLFDSIPVGTTLPAKIVEDVTGERGINIAGVFIKTELPDHLQNGSNVTLQVIGKGQAIICYTTSEGTLKNSPPLLSQESVAQAILKILGITEAPIAASFTQITDLETVLNERSLGDRDLLLKALLKLALPEISQTPEEEINTTTSFEKSLQSLTRLRAIFQIINNSDFKDFKASFREVVLQQGQALYELCERLPLLVGNGSDISPLQAVQDILKIPLKPSEEALSKLFQNVQEKLFDSSGALKVERIPEVLSDITKSIADTPRQARPLLRMLESRLQLLLLDESPPLFSKTSPTAMNEDRQLLQNTPAEQSATITTPPQTLFLQNIKSDLLSEIIKGTISKLSSEELDYFHSVESLLQIGVAEFAKPLEKFLAEVRSQPHNKHFNKNGADFLKENLTNSNTFFVLPDNQDHRNGTERTWSGAKSELLKTLSPIFSALGEPSFLIFPILLGGFFSNLEIIHYPQQEITEEEDTQNDKPQPFTRLSFKTELPTLGTIEAHLAYRSKEVLLNLGVVKKESIPLLENALPLLKAQLSKRGYEKIEVSLQQSTNTSIRPDWVNDVMFTRDGIFA
ncbi:MAG: flagellar hook-length control protein FliK [Bdellovibrionota bacterium]